MSRGGLELVLPVRASLITILLACLLMWSLIAPKRSVTSRFFSSRPMVFLGTYSYVNPAIAALLGWLVLHEHLSGVQLVGMAIIIVGVCILTVPGGSLTDPKTLAEPKTQ